MSHRKGIILAGGSGTRLFPSTISTTKQLLPIYDKPMIYYPLSTLMLSGIREILIISTPNDRERFENLLKNGNQWGLDISYATQDRPDGIASSFIIGKEFLDGKDSALILGDNIFYGAGLSDLLIESSQKTNIAVNFSYFVNDPSAYGVCEYDLNDKPIKIIEKPKSFLSNWAITGLYFYDSNVVDIAKSIKPSDRGELEISSINEEYLRNDNLSVQKLGRGYAWLDAGTYDNLLDASNFVRSIEKIQGLKIGCPEEVSWRMSYIDDNHFEKLVNTCPNESYRDYLKKILNNE